MGRFFLNDFWRNLNFFKIAKSIFVLFQEVCKTLIRSGAQIDPKDPDCFTPLHRACAADRNETVELLISTGANVENRNKNWETAWHIAAAHGAVSCLERLMPYPNVNIQDRCGRSQS